MIVFRKLERNDLLSIVQLEAAAVSQRLRNRNITLQYSNDVLNFLLDKGFEPEYGARPLRRAVERYLEDPLAEELLKGSISVNSTIEAVLDGENLRFTAKPLPAKPVRKRVRKSPPEK